MRKEILRRKETLGEVGGEVVKGLQHGLSHAR